MDQNTRGMFLAPFSNWYLLGYLIVLHLHQALTGLSVHGELDEIAFGSFYANMPV